MIAVVIVGDEKKLMQRLSKRVRSIKFLTRRSPQKTAIKVAHQIEPCDIVTAGFDVAQTI